MTTWLEGTSSKRRRTFKTDISIIIFAFFVFCFFLLPPHEERRGIDCCPKFRFWHGCNLWCRQHDYWLFIRPSLLSSICLIFYCPFPIPLLVMFVQGGCANCWWETQKRRGEKKSSGRFSKEERRFYSARKKERDPVQCRARLYVVPFLVCVLVWIDRFALSSSSLKERKNERTNERKKERTNERTKERKKERKRRERKSGRREERERKERREIER